MERITQSLAAHLALGGDEVTVFTRAATAPTRTPAPLAMSCERLADGTRVYRLTGTYEGLEHFLAQHERIEQHYRRVQIETAPDVVHILHLQDLSPRIPEISYQHGSALVYSLQDFYYACAQAHLLKPNRALCDGPRGGLECAETCFAEEGDSARRRWGLRTIYYRRILELAQRFIVPSRYVANFFERYGVEPARLELIPNAVFFPIASPRARENPTPQQRGRLHVAFVGSVIPHKGPHILFQALQLARVGPVRVLILGRTHGAEYAAQLRQSAAAIPQLELAWHGEYEPAELPALLADTDCVVMPSLIRETFGIVIEEALALGIPVLVSNTGAQSELIHEGENGFTFDPHRPAVLGALLYRFANDEELVVRLRSGASQTPVMSALEHARAVRMIYEKALAAGPVPQFARAAEQEERAWLVTELERAGFAGRGTNG